MKYKKSLYVTNVITLKAFRQQGVASQLFEELIRRYGKEEMVLDVKRHTADGPLSLLDRTKRYFFSSSVRANPPPVKQRSSASCRQLQKGRCDSCPPLRKKSCSPDGEAMTPFSSEEKLSGRMRVVRISQNGDRRKWRGDDEATRKSWSFLIAHLRGSCRASLSEGGRPVNFHSRR